MKDSKNFLLLLKKGMREYEQQRRRFYDLLGPLLEETITVPLPDLPRGEFCLEVELKVPFEVITLLTFYRLTEMRVKRICVEVEGREIALTLKEGEEITAEKVRVVITPQTPLAKFIPLLLFLRQLSEKKIDLLSTIEEELGRPGLFDEVRKIIQLASNMITQ